MTTGPITTDDRRDDEWMWHYPSTDAWGQWLGAGDDEPVMHADVPREHWEER